MREESIRRELEAVWERAQREGRRWNETEVLVEEKSTAKLLIVVWCFDIWFDLRCYLYVRKWKRVCLYMWRSKRDGEGYWEWTGWSYTTEYHELHSQDDYWIDTQWFILLLLSHLPSFSYSKTISYSLIIDIIIVMAICIQWYDIVFTIPLATSGLVSTWHILKPHIPH